VTNARPTLLRRYIRRTASQLIQPWRNCIAPTIIVSIADFYRNTDLRLAALQPQGFEFDKTPLEQPEFVQLLCHLKHIAAEQGHRHQ
jgi:hypothetical protein